MKLIAYICLVQIMLISYAQASEQVGIDQGSIKPISVTGTNSFEECAAVTMWTFSGKNINELVNSAVKDNAHSESTTSIPRHDKWLGLGSSAGTVKIPKGWSVVGTSFNNGEPLLFICH